MFMKKKASLAKEIQERVKKHRGQKYLILLLQILGKNLGMNLSITHRWMFTKAMPR